MGVEQAEMARSRSGSSERNSLSRARTNPATPALGSFPASERSASGAPFFSSFTSPPSEETQAQPHSQSVLSEPPGPPGSHILWQEPTWHTMAISCISHISSAISHLILSWNFAFSSLWLLRAFYCYSFSIMSMLLFSLFCLTASLLTSRHHPRMTYTVYFHS